MLPFCQDRFRVLQLFGNVDRLSAQGIFDRIAWLAFSLFDCGFDGLQHGRDVSGFFVATDGRRDRAATLVTEYYNQGAAKMLDSVFNAPQSGSVHYLSGGADDKDIAEALVEYDLGPDARIRAADNDRERHLAFCDRAAGFGDVSGSNMGHVAEDETGVALHESFERFIRTHVRWSGGEGTGEGAEEEGQSG